MIILLLLIGLFVVLGIVFINGKGSFLIAGYNTMPAEEKEKYDKAALCRFMGRMMFVISFFMLFWLLGILYDADWLFILGFILIIGLAIFMVIYVNTGNRFKR